MKRTYSIFVAMLFIVIQILFLAPKALSEQNVTTIGDSTFPAEAGDAFIWQCINSTGDRYNTGDLIKFTPEYIYNDTNGGNLAMIVNYSIDEYDILKGLWVRTQNNRFYMAYNN